jgi:hypothetical protein
MSEQNLVFPVATACKGKASIDEDGYRRVPHELKDQGFCAYVTRKAVVDGLGRERHVAT